MAKMVYPYSAIGAASEMRFRPMLDVVLSADDGTSLRWAALADTGADFCLFPLNAATMLGLDLKSLKAASTSGVGNAANLTYYSILFIDLENGFRFATLVGFTEGMNRAGFGLLGQQGFFENFNVEFRHHDRKFLVEPG